MWVCLCAVFLDNTFIVCEKGMLRKDAIFSGVFALLLFHACLLVSHSMVVLSSLANSCWLDCPSSPRRVSLLFVLLDRSFLVFSLALWEIGGCWVSETELHVGCRMNSKVMRIVSMGWLDLPCLGILGTLDFHRPKNLWFALPCSQFSILLCSSGAVRVLTLTNMIVVISLCSFRLCPIHIRVA